MKNDLISRSAVLQALRKAKEMAYEPPTSFDIYIQKTFDLCIRLVAAFNALDAVSVVRCKDCKRRYESEFCECRPDDAFCSDGVKGGSDDAQ